MTTYEPGTVAVATVRGVKGVRIMRTDGIGGGDTIWLSVGNVDHWRTHYDRDVTDIRPLVVLDLALAPASKGTARYIDWVEAQIEAQTRPPRIPEPGLWGVVEASSESNSSRRKWVHYGTGWRDAFDYHVEWDLLIDPVLVREGLS